MSGDLRASVIDALSGIIDPETGHDLVAMGLIRGVEIEGSSAHVSMTTTIRGCPMSDMLRMGAEAAVVTVPGITEAQVTLRWDPPWSPDRIGGGIWA